MTQPEFKRLVRLWQKRLRLSDWNVTAEIVASDPPTRRHLAETEFGSTLIDHAEVAADMLVRDFSGTEATLVHELLHLRLAPFSDGAQDEPEHEAREIAINLLADCFLRAYPKRKLA